MKGIQKIKEKILNTLDENKEGRVITIGTCGQCGKSFQIRDYTDIFCQKHKLKRKI